MGVAAAGLAVLGLAGLGACAPTPTPLSDPREILARSVEHLAAARSVHVDLAIDGTVTIGSILPAQGGGDGGAVGLAGTRVNGDLDLAGGRAAVHFEVPALLGLTGELRQVGSDAFLSSTLTSPGWHRIDVGALPLGVARPISWVEALRAWLDRPALVPARLDDTACRAGRCYVVRVAVDRGELTALASAAPGIAAALADASVTMDLEIAQTSLALSLVTMDIDLAAVGSLQAGIDFTAWNEAVSIEAPAASEIVDGPLLP